MRTKGKVMFRHDALAKGRYPRVPSRWDTDFGRWVADVGVPRIVATLSRDPQLRVTSQAVYEWLQGHAPHPARAMALVEMSQGRLTLDAIYQHARQMRQADEKGPR
jgi:hypothetical protein